jgi:hypothetical protein
LPTAKELPTSAEKLQKAIEKLQNGDELTDAEYRLLSPISMQNLAIKLGRVSAERQAEQRQQPPQRPDNQFFFTEDDLEQYIAPRKAGHAKKSLYWFDQSSEALWDCTKGEISHKSMTALRTFVLNTYSSQDSHSKVLGFAAGFLKFLAKTKIEPSYLSFEIS